MKFVLLLFLAVFGLGLLLRTVPVGTSERTITFDGTNILAHTISEPRYIVPRDIQVDGVPTAWEILPDPTISVFGKAHRETPDGAFGIAFVMVNGSSDSYRESYLVASSTQQTWQIPMPDALRLGGVGGPRILHFDADSEEVFVYFEPNRVLVFSLTAQESNRVREVPDAASSLKSLVLGDDDPAQSIHFCEDSTSKLASEFWRQLSDESCT